MDHDQFINSTAQSQDYSEGAKVTSKPKNSKPLIATSIICAILAVAGIAFGIYGMFLRPQPTAEIGTSQTDDVSPEEQPQAPTEETESYQLSDYVSFLETNIPVTFPDELEKGHTEDTITHINLQKINQDSITKYNQAQNMLKDENMGGYIITRSNKVDATINGELLSVYNIFNYNGIYQNYGKAATLNYNLNSNEEVSNDALLKQYNLTALETYEKILRQLVNNVETQSFLLNTKGDVTGPAITIEEFRNNIPEYAEKLIGNLDAVSLYIDSNNTVHALYQQNEILEQLGMGTHMGIGLQTAVQDATL